MGIKSIPFKSTPERMVQAEMKKRRVRRWFLAVFAVLLIILLYIVISFLQSDKRFLANDLQNSWNSSIQCSDDQIDFAYHDSYSTDAYYVLQGENVRLNLSDSTSNPEATYQYVRIEGNGTFSEIQMQNGISADHLIDLERVPQEYAPSGYWENSNTVYPYILLKRYADDKYDGFLLVLDDADANGLYLMQCLD